MINTFLNTRDRKKVPGLWLNVVMLWCVAVCLIVSKAFCGTNPEPLDKSKYIGIDEIRPDMDAYCLTVLKDTNIEKFELKVLSVVRNFRPGRDAILVLEPQPIEQVGQTP